MDRPLLRPIRGEDAAAVFELYGDPRVCEFLDIAPFKSIDQAKDHVAAWLRRAEAGTQIRYALELEGRVVGTCGLYSIYRHQDRATLGYDLRPEFWGQGLMAAALEDFLELCFGDWQFVRIQALVLPSHGTSRRLLEKLQFQFEGRLAAYEKWEGRGMVDLDMFARINSGRAPGVHSAAPVA